MRYFLSICLFSLGLSTYAQQDTIHVYFDAKSTELNSAALQTIDSNIYYDILIKGKRVGIIGYADYPGTSKSNTELSITRAQTVAKYLVSMGIPETDIETIEGKGEITRMNKDKKGNPEDRRVDIIPGGFDTTATTQPIPITDLPVAKPLSEIASANTDDIIRLDRIEFEPGTDNLLDESIPTLKALHETMHMYPTLKIQIEGHVCCYGVDKLPEEANQKAILMAEEIRRYAGNLSQKRAKKVSDYLIKHGVSQNRIQTKGLGISVPLYEADGKTIKQQKNRRVEIRVLEK